MATLLPTVLALNLPPSPTLLNQCLAIACWGTAVALIGQLPSQRPAHALLAQAWPAVVAIGLLVLCGIASAVVGSWPASLALSTLPSIAVSVVVLYAADRAYRGHPQRVAASFFVGVLCAGLINAVIGIVQVFWPDAPDGDWMARSSAAGRAVGNLRQPNHLSSLLLWSLAVVAGMLESGRMTRRAAWAAGALLLGATVLTGSRTGIVGVLLLCAWGLFDKRLTTTTRRALAVTPILYGLIWCALTIWAHVTGQLFGGETRLTAVASGSDISSSRLAIWLNTLGLVADQPLLGVGFGEFNVAWSLTQFPTRPTAFFDHAHNIVLQLWAEIGLPLGTTVVALLILVLIRGWRIASACQGHDGVDRRVALMLLLMIGLHSMLEYPLWYDYFLLPTAFACGIVLSPGAPIAQPPATAPPTGPPPVRAGIALTIAGAAMVLGAFVATLDYRTVAQIYSPPEFAAPLEERIASGQRSLLFGHHADYAAATAYGEPQAPLSPSQQLAFRRAPHQLLDVRLMIAWSQALAAEGELDKARWLAARIREFRNPGADEFFEPCSRPQPQGQPFQCQPPSRAVHWREFTAQR